MTDKRSVQGDVRSIGRGGDAVVQTENGVVLVPGALPGERVLLELASSRRGAARGRLQRVLRRAEGRIAPPCPETTRCGGCPLMIANAVLQREVKLGFLRDACRGLPGADDVEVQWVASPHELGYRRRARLAWHRSTLGYRPLRSKRVADIAECMVLMPPLRVAWTETRKHLAGALRGTGEIQLELVGERRAVVALVTGDDQAPALFDACAALSRQPPIASVTLRGGETVAPAVWGEEHTVLFSQANEGINAALVDKVAELAEPEDMRVLELHCGVGNFTVALASRAPAALVAVEQNPRAVQLCQADLARQGLRARVTVGDANQPPKGRHDVVVLDPPRQGARALFEESDLLPGPKRIVYVSCDTATLRRDLRLAADRGYRIDRMIGFDMFPQTAHLESLVRLVRV
jgi:23S rRNA (uracil1939-C5)-methyltransferase